MVNFQRSDWARAFKNMTELVFSFFYAINSEAFHRDIDYAVHPAFHNQYGVLDLLAFGIPYRPSLECAYGRIVDV